MDYSLVTAEQRFELAAKLQPMLETGTSVNQEEAVGGYLLIADEHIERPIAVMLSSEMLEILIPQLEKLREQVTWSSRVIEINDGTGTVQ